MFMSSNATQIVANFAQASPSIHIDPPLIPMSNQPLRQDTEAASLGLGLISFRELCRKDPRQAMQVASSRLATIRKREAIQVKEDAKKARVEAKNAENTKNAEEQQAAKQQAAEQAAEQQAAEHAASAQEQADKQRAQEQAARQAAREAARQREVLQREGEARLQARLDTYAARSSPAMKLLVSNAKLLMRNYSVSKFGGSNEFAAQQLLK
jgi:flagellar biosynthesis GTPase FlhF